MAFARARRHTIDHDRFVDGLQRSIASWASRERSRRSNALEPSQHLDELPTRLDVADEVAVSHLGALQQIDIAREQQTGFGGGDRCEVGVRGIVAIRRIESSQPEVRGKPTEMNVRDKANPVWGDPREPSCVPEIQGVERRIRGNAIPIANQVPEIDEFAVRDEAIDFRVRNAERFDHVLDG